MTGLPDGWALAPLDAVVGAGGLFVDGDWVESKDQDQAGEVRLTQLADVGDGNWRNRSDRYMNADTKARLACTELQVDDVLIARMPDPLGRACLFPGDPRPCVTVVDVAIMRPGEGSVDPPWLMHAINAPLARAAIESLQSGTTRKRISRKNLATIELPVAPRAEQQRIVAAIEEAFSKLDTGDAGLQFVRQLLKRLRESILAAAVSGRLVPQDPADAQASKLLADLGVKPLPEGDLPEVPNGWTWALISSVAAAVPNALAIGPFGSNLKVADYTDEGVPLVFVRNIRRRDFRAGLKFVNEQKAEQLASHCVHHGDVLITKMGDPPGDTAVYTEKRAAIITADCIKITCGPSTHPDYLALAIAGGETRRLLLGVTRGVAQKKVSLGRFRSLPVPVPPLEEQARIVAEFERQMSFVEACERAVDAGLERSAALRRSVLKAAFEGRLVPQDPTDEPASVLLERIRAERATAPKAKARGTKAKS